MSIKCLEFILRSNALACETDPVSERDRDSGLRILDLEYRDYTFPARRKIAVSAVIFTVSYHPLVAKFWQHTGDGLSSRRAESCQLAFDRGNLMPRAVAIPQHLFMDNTCKGPLRYQSLRAKNVCRTWCMCRSHSKRYVAQSHEEDYNKFVEEHFGRNLDMSLALHAKTAIRRRIARCLNISGVTHDTVQNSTETIAAVNNEQVCVDNVYLYPSGMSSLFNTHQLLLKSRGFLKSIMFG